MPYKRPTLTELRARTQSAITTGLEKIGALLRFSNMRVLGDVCAGMSHLHFGFLDWIARQTNPSTATGEFLAMWGALVRVYRKPATAATGQSVPITGTVGYTAKAGTVLNRGDGYQYTLDTDLTIGSTGTVLGSVTAVLPDASADSSGGGASGNAAAGTSLRFDIVIEGIDSSVTLTTAITGGTDIEGEEAFRSRVLGAFQNTPQGGSDADYKKWALAVPGVTRAWVVRRLMGAGTVGVYIMLDGNNGTNDSGFPVGTDGVSSHEKQYPGGIASGNQLTVADSLYNQQPATAVVYVCSPIKTSVPFTISGLSGASAALKASINAAIDAVFFNSGAPGGKIDLSDIQGAISGISGTSGFIIVSPATNIVMATGCMPVRGVMTYL
ncbi:baseplate J/gp47 family protein [Pantoea brenneri]|uniref:baseplate J/gp47 family protein n=1 Tax=Pantoea brenneri TaxID=472694 RepID=UPI002448C1B8|nr:baseplate J/gp47 family protein [Pantoea brenneri]MDH1088849.1 baseplate J/gp47 family protein [Pantoea brenneri]